MSEGHPTLKCGDLIGIPVSFYDENPDGSRGDPLDVSGRTWLAQLRPEGRPDGPPVVTFTVDDTNSATGKLVLRLTTDQSAAVPPEQRFYRVEVEDLTNDFTWISFVVEAKADYAHA